MPISFKTYDWKAPEGQREIEHVNQYAGAVLSWTRECVQVMSDIWENQIHVVVWDEATQAPKTFVDPTSKVVDATDEVIKKYIAWRSKVVFENRYEMLLGQARTEAATVRVGSTVKVLSGRKRVGEGPFIVFHLMEKMYNMGYKSQPAMMAGVALDDKKSMKPGKNGKMYNSYDNVDWIWVRNLEVTNRDELEKPLIADAKERAKTFALLTVKSAVEEIKKQRAADASVAARLLEVA